MADNKAFEMTLEGVNRLNQELDERKVEKRTEIAERIKVALSFGDLSENSEYDDAKQAQAENEARITEIEELLKHVRILDEDEISTSVVTVGSLVTLKEDSSGSQEVYTLVNPQEEDILENKISTDSPVGAAILGKKRNQVVRVTTPAGQYKYKIMKIAKE